jgi:ABC-type transport system substrate-binding protein
MKRTGPMLAVSLLVLTLTTLALADPGWAQAKPELTVALSSFSTETLDPVLGGHIVKYYLSLMFDYLVGSTLDGQPSPAGGLAARWEN